MIDSVPLALTFAQLAIAKAESECETLIIGADSFTPDGRLIMKESTEVTELIRNGNTNLSTWPVHIRHFIRLHTNKRFFQDRLREISGKQYSMRYPTYGEVLGYEHPLFFKPDETGKQDFEDLSKQGTFGIARWFKTIKKEYNTYNIIYKI
ncbi:unnamed protein product [Adineta steineri]|uniref:Uncharacterized protein n=1 Tax=Adineta steineri TaxID=433720 RepID=A0A820AL21_9BILA|nr:unnamed protein product [Adineta steineri]CAF4187147.1 unnamed protein product [Adineta steineri]